MVLLFLGPFPHFVLFVPQSDAMAQAAQAVEKHTHEKDISKAVKVLIYCKLVVS